MLNFGIGGFANSRIMAANIGFCGIVADEKIVKMSLLIEPIYIPDALQYPRSKSVPSVPSVPFDLFVLSVPSIPSVPFVPSVPSVHSAVCLGT